MAAPGSCGGHEARRLGSHHHGDHRVWRALHPGPAARRLVRYPQGTQVNRLRILRPDDWHVHLRDGAALEAVVGFTAQRFGRAIVMPNLKTPIATADMARAYSQRILSPLPAGSRSEPLLTLYLTNSTTADEIDRA